MDEVIGFRLLCLVQSNNLKYKALSTVVDQPRHPAGTGSWPRLPECTFTHILNTKSHRTGG